MKGKDIMCCDSVTAAETISVLKPLSCNAFSSSGSTVSMILGFEGGFEFRYESISEWQDVFMLVIHCFLMHIMSN